MFLLRILTKSYIYSGETCINCFPTGTFFRTVITWSILTSIHIFIMLHPFRQSRTGQVCLIFPSHTHICDNTNITDREHLQIICCRREKIKSSLATSTIELSFVFFFFLSLFCSSIYLSIARDETRFRLFQRVENVWIAARLPLHFGAETEMGTTCATLADSITRWTVKIGLW